MLGFEDEGISQANASALEVIEFWKEKYTKLQSSEARGKGACVSISRSAPCVLDLKATFLSVNELPNWKLT